MIKDPVVVSDTKQHWNGVNWYLSGFYFGNVEQRPRRLHVAVWAAHHGPVPKGHHIHHIDHDRSNNAIANLACIDGHSHLVGHSTTAMRAAASERMVRLVHLAAKEWHGTEAGREWHRRHMRDVWVNIVARGPLVLECAQCGGPVECLTAKRVVYCDSGCKTRALRARKAAGTHAPPAFREGMCGVETPTGPCRRWPAKGGLRCRWHL